jgi:hypothetical protein
MDTLDEEHERRGGGAGLAAHHHHLRHPGGPPGPPSPAGRPEGGELLRVQGLSCKLPHGRAIVSGLTLSVERGVNSVLANGGAPKDLPFLKREAVAALKIDYATQVTNSYPAVLVTYEITCEKGLAADQAALVKSFLSYTSGDAAQGELTAVGYVPITGDLLTSVRKSVSSLA